MDKTQITQRSEVNTHREESWDQQKKVCLAGSTNTRCARGDVPDVFLTTLVRSKSKEVTMVVLAKRQEENTRQLFYFCQFIRTVNLNTLAQLNYWSICVTDVLLWSTILSAPAHNWTHFECIHKWITRLFIFPSTIKGKLIILLCFRLHRSVKR